MNIYIGHSRDEFDYKRKLYNPIKSSFLNSDFNIILPHEKNELPYDSKEFFSSGCDFFIAEVSYPSLGLGMEIQMAADLNIPILCIYNSNSKKNGFNSLKTVNPVFIEYKNETDLILKIKEYFKKKNFI